MLTKQGTFRTWAGQTPTTTEPHATLTGFLRKGSRLAAGYRVIVTADHGMGEDRSHGGTDAAERRVPCFCFGEGMKGLAVTEEPVKQRYLAAFFARTLGLTPALTMADGAEHIKFAPVYG